MYPYKPDKETRIGSWIIRIFEDEHKAIVKSIYTGRMFVIDDEVDLITRLPNYVVKYLKRTLFYKRWNAVKVHESVTKLNEISQRFEKLKERGEI